MNMKTKIRISLLQIVGLALYMFWAMGNPHISIWHWIAPLTLDWMDQIVDNIILNKK